MASVVVEATKGAVLDGQWQGTDTHRHTDDTNTHTHTDIQTQTQTHTHTLSVSFLFRMADGPVYIVVENGVISATQTGTPPEGNSVTYSAAYAFPGFGMSLEWSLRTWLTPLQLQLQLQLQLLFVTHSPSPCF